MHQPKTIAKFAKLIRCGRTLLPRAMYTTVQSADASEQSFNLSAVMYYRTPVVYCYSHDLD